MEKGGRKRILKEKLKTLTNTLADTFFGELIAKFNEAIIQIIIKDKLCELNDHFHLRVP